MMKTNVKEGKLIVFCGVDGSGKTTQIELAANWLKENNIPYIVTKQPTDWYRNDSIVRTFLDNGENLLGLEGLALFAASDRQYHINSLIKPNLENGRWVISDRYVYSTYAYFMTRGTCFNFLKNININIPVPSATIYLDICAEEAFKRISARDFGRVKFEDKKIDFLNNVRNNFKVFVEKGELNEIDALLPREVIHDKIRSILINLFE